MELLKSCKVKFKLETHEIEEIIEREWTIGKIKGKLRKSLKINPYYTLQLLYQGRVLEDNEKFKEINYAPDTIIKVMASRTSEL